MLFDSIGIKIAIKFFEKLKKHQMIVENIKLSFYDGRRVYYQTFSDLASMNSYYILNYSLPEICKVGSFVNISSFNIRTQIYKFSIFLTVRDLCSDLSISPGMDFDNERNQVRENFRNKQHRLLEKIINEYCNINSEIRNFYTTGIYSPCYAEAGWSEGTGRLKELKRKLDNNEIIFK